MFLATICTYFLKQKQEDLNTINVNNNLNGVPNLNFTLKALLISDMSLVHFEC